MCVCACVLLRVCSRARARFFLFSLRLRVFACLFVCVSVSVSVLVSVSVSVSVCLCLRRSLTKRIPAPGSTPQSLSHCAGALQSESRRRDPHPKAFCTAPGPYKPNPGAGITRLPRVPSASLMLSFLVCFCVSSLVSAWVLLGWCFVLRLFWMCFSTVCLVLLRFLAYFSLFGMCFFMVWRYFGFGLL